MNDEDFERLANRGGNARPLSARERGNAEAVLQSYAVFPHDWDEAEQARYYAPDFYDHSTLHGATFADMVTFTKMLRRDFPHTSIAVERLVVDGDYVVAHVQPRLSPDHAPDAAIEIYRFEDGRIAEHWDVIRPNADLAPASS